MDVSVNALQGRISTLELELQALKAQLSATTTRLKPGLAEKPSHPDSPPSGQRIANRSAGAMDDDPWTWPLREDEYPRYGRQMIVPEFGLEGQLKLKKGSVLVVGLGGLGCPAATYLAGAGVGHIGLIDGDEVELSNLHRQVLHRTETVGMKKVDSALLALRRLNPSIRYTPYRENLSPENAARIFSGYDIILDCTDQPASRYLISDMAVLLGKPLVFASALGTDGQLMVLNNPPLPPGQTSGGPCYRCIFPRPPLVEHVKTCAEGGILGPVVGLMGVYQALQTIKLLLSDLTPSSSPVKDKQPGRPPTLFLFSAFHGKPFQEVRLRVRRPGCLACSALHTITPESIAARSYDYLEFCGAIRPASTLTQDERFSVGMYNQLKQAGTRHVLIDVRERAPFNISHLDGSINIPFSELQFQVDQFKDDGQTRPLPAESSDLPVFVVCRLGNDSQLAVRYFKEQRWLLDRPGQIRHVEGGLKAWKLEVDPTWPYL